MFEDDFELDDQPENIRDRDIPGRGPSRRRPRGQATQKKPQGNGHTQRAPRDRVKHEFPEEAKPARDLLAEILTRMGVPHAEIEYIPRPEGEYLEVMGPDL